LTGIRALLLIEQQVHKQRHRWPGFPWTFFLVLFAASIPLWILGGLFDTQLMPGLRLNALMFICTALVACIFSANKDGSSGVRKLILRCVDFRKIGSIGWFLTSLLLMPGVLFASYLTLQSMGLPLPVPSIPWAIAPLLLLVFFFTAACEELAWSATVLDPLQDRFGTLAAGFIIGAIGAAWHVVPFVQVHPSTSWVLGQCLFTVAFRVVLVWLYNNTGGSVVAVSLCHATYNVAWQLFPNRGSGYDPWIVATLTILFAIVVTLGWRSNNFSERGIELPSSGHS
jgi:membrane protease YdiL (CAAX protease family)